MRNRLTFRLIGVKYSVMGSETQTSRYGFPSPGEDCREDRLDIRSLLVRHPSSTYYLRSEGDAMAPLISRGDIMVADRALRPRSGDIVIVELDGSFCVRRLVVSGQRLLLCAENPGWEPSEAGADLVCFGVVTGVVRVFGRQG